MVVRRVMDAKLDMSKTIEGRLETKCYKRIKKDAKVMYACHKDSATFIIVTEPIRHSNVKTAIQSIGWQRMTPWVNDAEECLREYASLYLKKPVTYAAAVEWATKMESHRVPFVTWEDTEVSRNIDEVLAARRRVYT